MSIITTLAHAHASILGYMCSILHEQNLWHACMKGWHSMGGAYMYTCSHIKALDYLIPTSTGIWIEDLGVLNTVQNTDATPVLLLSYIPWILTAATINFSLAGWLLIFGGNLLVILIYLIYRFLNLWCFVVLPSCIDHHACITSGNVSNNWTLITTVMKSAAL